MAEAGEIRRVRDRRDPDGRVYCRKEPLVAPLAYGFTYLLRGPKDSGGLGGPVADARDGLYDLGL